MAAARRVAWVDPGDTLDPNTLAVVGGLLQQSTWIYTDEAVGDDGMPADLWYKPDFSPERLRSQPYAVRLAALPAKRFERSAASVRMLALPRGTTLSYGRPLGLDRRFTSRARTTCTETGAITVFRLLSEDPRTGAGVSRARQRRPARTPGSRPSMSAGRPIGQRVRRYLLPHPRISLVIPTRASSSLIHGFPRCHAVEFVRNLWNGARYPNLEVVVVYDTGTPAEALREIRDITGGAAVLVPFVGTFHFSRKCNAGALAATGEYLCFLNDDMEVVTPDWLHEMAGLLADPSVGAVVALLFADGTLQHAGHEYIGGQPGHTMFRYAADDPDQGGAALITSERSGVTGACMLLRAHGLPAVGGFSEEFPRATTTSIYR